MRSAAGIALTLLLAIAAAGCSKDEPKSAAPAMGNAPLVSGMAKLSAADQKLAKAQGVCPVSGEPLGAMGTPVRIEYEGTVVFFCCEKCKPKFEADPAKYMAKLKK